MRIEYSSNFSSEYFRSNRQKDWKTMRCFPKCNPGGHREHGFCGANFVVQVHDFEDINLALCEAWAFLTTSNKAANYSPGVILDYDKDIMVNLRTKTTPQRDWILGIINNANGTITFNQEGMSWNYAWSSNKYATNTMHVLKCIVCLRNENNLTILAEMTSSGFNIYSRAKKQDNSRPRSQSDISMSHPPSSWQAATLAHQLGVPQVGTRESEWERHTRDRLFNLVFRWHTYDVSEVANIRLASPEYYEKLASRVYKAWQLKGTPPRNFGESKLLAIFKKLGEMLKPTNEIYSVSDELCEKVTKRVSLSDLIQLAKDEISFNSKQECVFNTVEYDLDREHSVYGAFRTVYHEIVDEALRLENINIASINEAMNYASEEGLVYGDIVHTGDWSFHNYMRVQQEETSDVADFSPPFHPSLMLLPQNFVNKGKFVRKWLRAVFLKMLVIFKWCYRRNPSAGDTALFDQRSLHTIGNWGLCITDLKNIAGFTGAVGNVFNIDDTRNFLVAMQRFRLIVNDTTFHVDAVRNGLELTSIFTMNNCVHYNVSFIPGLAVTYCAHFDKVTNELMVCLQTNKQEIHANEIRTHGLLDTEFLSDGDYSVYVLWSLKLDSTTIHNFRTKREEFLIPKSTGYSMSMELVQHMRTNPLFQRYKSSTTTYYMARRFLVGYEEDVTNICQ